MYYSWCIFRNEIRLGDRNLTSSSDDVAVQSRKIIKRLNHPKYAFPSSYYDVAIIEMDKPVTFTNYVRPICLPVNHVDDVDNRADDFVTLTGWGKEKSDSRHNNGVLKQVPVKIYSQV